jgi:hypothetical protein
MKMCQEDVMRHTLRGGIISLLIGAMCSSLARPEWVYWTGVAAWAVFALCLGSFVTTLALPDPFTRKRIKVRLRRRKLMRKRRREAAKAKA